MATRKKPTKVKQKSNSPAKAKPAVKTAAKKQGATSPRADFWLFKSEPDVFSFEKLMTKGTQGEEWDGVRNYLARNNMRAMRKGDRGFFYHSNLGKEIVGICEVVREAHPDSTTDDERWECVDVKAVCALPKPVTLAEVKANPKLEKMALVTSMRLSVQPVTKAEWDEVCRMGGLDAKTLKPAKPQKATGQSKAKTNSKVKA